jgi:hypothetical protein
MPSPAGQSIGDAGQAAEYAGDTAGEVMSADLLKLIDSLIIVCTH